MITDDNKASRYDPMFGVRLSKELKNKVDNCAKVMHLSSSDLFRAALQYYLDKIDTPFYHIEKVSQDEHQIISPDGKVVYTGLYKRAYPICKALNKQLLP